MSEHAKEPWRLFTTYAHPEIRGEDDTFVAAFKPEYIANASRIVACVNACEGIDTEVLEITHGLDAIYNQKKQERDELLAALQYHQEQTRPIQRTIDVIAKMKGGAR